MFWKHKSFISLISSGWKFMICCTSDHTQLHYWVCSSQLCSTCDHTQQGVMFRVNQYTLLHQGLNFNHLCFHSLCWSSCGDIKSCCTCSLGLGALVYATNISANASPAKIILNHSKPQIYSVYHNVWQRKTINYHIWGAETSLFFYIFT